jgi:hypothetical protein
MATRTATLYVPDGVDLSLRLVFVQCAALRCSRQNTAHILLHGLGWLGASDNKLVGCSPREDTSQNLWGWMLVRISAPDAAGLIS